MQNLELIRAFEKSVEAGDFSRLDAIFHADVVYHDFVYGDFRGHAALSEFFRKWSRDGRDYVWRFYDVMADEHRAYASWYFSYTRLRGLPRASRETGVRLEILGMSRFAFRDNRISEYREVLNPATSLQAMGLSDALAARQLRRHARRERAEIAAIKANPGLQ